MLRIHYSKDKSRRKEINLEGVVTLQARDYGSLKLEEVMRIGHTLEIFQMGWGQ